MENGIHQARKNCKNQAESEGQYELRLYVAGQTARSMEAFANLKKICEEHLKGQCTIEVIDLLENPRLAKGDQILAIPTLVRRLPEPVRKIIGTFGGYGTGSGGIGFTPAQALKGP